MSRIAALLRGEPVAVAALVQLIVGLGVVFGTDWLEEAVAGAVGAAVTLTSLVARHCTTPATDTTQPAVVKPATSLSRL
ncbi:MAG: hypothetical protein GEV08_10195 [Acidimicrobiia bacterium]|nr:hypothetical protein [Acidimicrobiia bacterium]